MSYLKTQQNVQPNYTSPPKADTPKNKTTDLDIYLGSKLRARRLLLGLSQEKLGDAVGLTFQQVQKYERGINRISASRLYQLAKALDASVTYFFDGIEESSSQGGLAEEGRKYEPNPLANRETMELIRAYYQIEDLKVRKSLLDLARNLAKQQNSESAED